MKPIHQNAELVGAEGTSQTKESRSETWEAGPRPGVDAAAAGAFA